VNINIENNNNKTFLKNNKNQETELDRLKKIQKPIMKDIKESEMTLINRLIIVSLSVLIMSILLLLFMQYLIKISNIQKDNCPFTEDELILICNDPSKYKKKF
jgi:hypothetical protein